MIKTVNLGGYSADHSRMTVRIMTVTIKPSLFCSINWMSSMHLHMQMHVHTKLCNLHVRCVVNFGPGITTSSQNYFHQDACQNLAIESWSVLLYLLLSLRVFVGICMSIRPHRTTILRHSAGVILISWLDCFGPGLRVLPHKSLYRLCPVIDGLQNQLKK